MKTLITLLLTCTTTFLMSQTNFEKTYLGGWKLNNPNDIQQTTDGGYIMGGGSLIKIDVLGDTLWTKRHFTTGQYSTITGVTQTSDGGFAYSLSTNTGTTWNMTLVKTNSTGDSTFTVTYGGTTENYGTNLITTSDGGYLLSGTKMLGGTDPRIYVVKTDNIGNEQWSYDHPVYSQTTTNSLVEIPGNKFVLVGQENQDAVLIKLDNTGTVIWSKTHGTTEYELGRGLSPTTSGGFLFTGFQYNFTDASFSLYLVKTDVDGDTLWTRNEKRLYNEPFNRWNGYGFDVKEMTNGNLILTGSYNCYWNTVIEYGGQMLMYLSVNGDVVNDTSYACNYTNAGTAIETTTDGGYIITGGIEDGIYNFGPTLLIKLDNNLCVYPTDTSIVLMNTGAPNLFCGGAGFVLNTSTTCSDILWDNGSTNAMIAYNPPYNLPGTYSATFTNNYGCSTVSAIVLDTFLTVQPVIQSTTGATSFCAGDSLILFVSDEYVDYGLASSWVVSNDTTTIYNGGSYSITVQDTNGCYLNSDFFIVTENPLPTPNISLQLNGDLVSSEVTGNQWYLDGSIISGATNQTYTPLVVGTYTVEVTDVNGCTGTSAPYVLNSVGIVQVTQPDVYSYVNGVLTVLQGSWFLYDLSGRVVTSGGTGTYTIPDGIYLLQTKAGTQRIAHLR